MRQETPDQKIYDMLLNSFNDSSRRIQMDDIYIYIVDMPVEEAVSPCDGLGYTVYINARLSQRGRFLALAHALSHVLRDDFAKDDVGEIECQNERDIQSFQMDGEPSDI